MITVIHFFHLYQPPTQSKEMIDRIVIDSYALLSQLMRKYPRFRATINFSGSLLELLEKFGYQSLLEEYKALAVSGQIELVGSAMYHPILALLPEEEVRRQIFLQTEISQRIFGEAYHPTGFFIPEMAYSRKVADGVRSLGYDWLILDAMHFPTGVPDDAVCYALPDNGLRVLFRDRFLSKTFPSEYIFEHKNELANRALIVAHDGELYGHWHKDDRGYYERIFTDENISSRTVSEYLHGLDRREMVSPREASWESSENEISQGEPFILWNARGNVIHQKMWTLASLTIENIRAHEQDENFLVARRYADRGLASCAWWWATGAKLSSFSPPSWSPADIERGALELIRATRSLKILPLANRLEAELLYADICACVWQTHWKREEESLLI